MSVLRAGESSVVCLCFYIELIPCGILKAVGQFKNLISL